MTRDEVVDSWSNHFHSHIADVNNFFYDNDPSFFSKGIYHFKGKIDYLGDQWSFVPQISINNNKFEDLIFCIVTIVLTLGSLISFWIILDNSCLIRELTFKNLRSSIH